MTENSTQSSGERERVWTWGDWVLLATPFVLIAYAAVDAAGLAGPAQADAKRAFWLAWLAGSAVAGLWGLFYVVGPKWQRSAHARERHRAIVVWSSPFLGVLGMILFRLADTLTRFWLLGAASGFMLVVMLGYAVLRRRRA